MRHVSMTVQGEENKPYTQHWASLDGEDWIPIERAPTDEDTDNDLRAVFNGVKTSGGGNLRPLRFNIRYLKHLVSSGNAKITEGTLS